MQVTQLLHPYSYRRTRQDRSRSKIRKNNIQNVIQQQEMRQKSFNIRNPKAKSVILLSNKLKPSQFLEKQKKQKKGSEKNFIIKTLQKKEKLTKKINENLFNGAQLKYIQQRNKTVRSARPSLGRPSRPASSQKKVLKIDDFVLQNQNSLQTSSSVNAYYKSTNEFVIISQQRSGSKKLNIVHPNMIKVKGTLNIGDQSYVVVEKGNRKALQSFVNRFPFSQKLIKKFIEQLLLGLKTLHKKNKAHNRLNMKNLYITVSQRSLLLDQTEAMLKKLTCKEKLQHFGYFSPEQLVGKLDELSNDIWAVGYITLVMGTGNLNSELHPYFRNDQEGLGEQIIEIKEQLKGKKKKKQKVKKDEDLSEQLRSFIKACFQIDEQKRPTVQQLLKHQFLE